jgi:hypothetical protein
MNRDWVLFNLPIMDEDPAVQAGVFTYDVHPIRSFPGD